MMMRKNKKGIIEMSVGTIVTIVLLIALLIGGIYFFKNIFSHTEYEITYNICYNKTITPLYRFDLYVSEGCPHCANQKEILGPYLDEVGSIIDCASEGSKCSKANITGVPTWKIHGEDEQYVGVHTINQLAGILGEVSYNWTCEDIETNTIFSEKNNDINTSITEALTIQKETNVSFKDECEGYGGEFIQENLSAMWICRFIETVPIINQTDITGRWLENNENCGLISLTKDDVAFRCYDKFIVREK